MVDESATTITTKVAKQIQGRLEKELLGAWRAGYDYLYVAPDTSTQHLRRTDDLSFRVSYRVLPTNHQLQHNPFDVPMEQYDLSSLTAEEYNEYV